MAEFTARSVQKAASASSCEYAPLSIRTMSPLRLPGGTCDDVNQLPQLFNVLKGDAFLVGLRPLVD